MFNKILCSFLCGCLVFMGLSASGGNIHIKTDHNANPYKALKKSDAKAEKTVNSDEYPYNYVVHNSGDPAPDELNYFIKGTDVDWMADFLQNHNDINYCLVLDKENNPVGILGNKNISSENAHNTVNEMYSMIKGVPTEIIKDKSSINNFWYSIEAKVIDFGGPISFMPCFAYTMNGSITSLRIFTFCAGLILLSGFVVWKLFTAMNKNDNSYKIYHYNLNISNYYNKWIGVMNTICLKKNNNYETLYLYPKSNYSYIENLLKNNADAPIKNIYYRLVGPNGYYGYWNSFKLENMKTATQKVFLDDQSQTASFGDYTNADSDHGNPLNSLGFSDGNVIYSNISVHDPDQGYFLTKNYDITLGKSEALGLKSSPSESYFMFGLNNQASSALPYNVHFVSTTDDINGGYFILPQSSEMNWNTSDDHIPVPNANIFDPNDYAFENIADNENVTPYYEKDKNPGYDYMQITQSGKYCVFPIGFTGKDNSSSSTLEVWISPKNGTAEDSYIHVGNIKAQYSSSDSQWHFTYTPVSTPSGWNVTAEKIDITGTSKEDMLNGTQLDNFDLSIVQENSRKMAIQLLFEMKNMFHFKHF